EPLFEGREPRWGHLDDVIRAPAAAVEGAIGGGQGVLIGAQEAQVVRAIVAPIAVNVVDMQGDTASDGVAFGPAADHTAAVAQHEIVANSLGRNRPGTYTGRSAAEPRFHISAA